MSAPPDGSRRSARRVAGRSRLNLVTSIAVLGIVGMAAVPLAADAWPSPGVAAVVRPPAPVSHVSAPVAEAARAVTAAETAAPQGDLPGWHQIFLEDFTTDAPVGSFPGRAYRDRWMSYDGFQDTWGTGLYDPDRVLSVHDGVLDFWLHTDQGIPRVAAPVPLLDGSWGGQLYGKATVRFRADPVAGYSPSFLFWPDSDVWGQGEIDVAEGDLSQEINQYSHCLGAAIATNCATAERLGAWSDWHTAGFEWTPHGVVLFFDGRAVATTDVAPQDPMHLVLQVQARPDVAAEVQGHLQVDWVALYGYAPA